MIFVNRAIEDTLKDIKINHPYDLSHDLLEKFQGYLSSKSLERAINDIEMFKRIIKMSPEERIQYRNMLGYANNHLAKVWPGIIRRQRNANL